MLSLVLRQFSSAAYLPIAASLAETAALLCAQVEKAGRPGVCAALFADCAALLADIAVAERALCSRPANMVSSSPAASAPGVEESRVELRCFERTRMIVNGAAATVEEAEARLAAAQTSGAKLSSGGGSSGMMGIDGTPASVGGGGDHTLEPFLFALFVATCPASPATLQALATGGGSGGGGGAVGDGMPGATPPPSSPSSSTPRLDQDWRSCGAVRMQMLRLCALHLAAALSPSSSSSSLSPPPPPPPPPSSSHNTTTARDPWWCLPARRQLLRLVVAELSSEAAEAAAQAGEAEEELAAGKRRKKKAKRKQKKKGGEDGRSSSESSSPSRAPSSVSASSLATASSSLLAPPTSSYPGVFSLRPVTLPRALCPGPAAHASSSASRSRSSSSSSSSYGRGGGGGGSGGGSGGGGTENAGNYASNAATAPAAARVQRERAIAAAVRRCPATAALRFARAGCMSARLLLVAGEARAERASVLHSDSQGRR